VGRANKSHLHEEHSPNITPLADVTTTLIIVFMMTMPAILGNGIQVNATRAEASESVVTTREQADQEMLMVSVAPEGIKVNGEEVLIADLELRLRDELATRTDKTVVIVPSDFVKLGDVVDVMDAAKGGGASSLALLNRKEEAR